MVQAIKYYSRANNIKPGDPVILNNRSAAYIRFWLFIVVKFIGTDVFFTILQYYPFIIPMIPTSRISQFLKDRPPAASEYRPLNGLDPTVHAEVILLANCFLFIFILNIAYFVNSSTTFQLALKDAEKLMDLRGKSVKPYILKANALMLVRISNCLRPQRKIYITSK